MLLRLVRRLPLLDIQPPQVVDVDISAYSFRAGRQCQEPGAWRAVYEEVRRRHGQGGSLLGISRAMGLARSTVRKFVDAADFPERAMRRPGPTILQPHLAYLAMRLSQGYENALALWRELRAGASHAPA